MAEIVLITGFNTQPPEGGWQIAEPPQATDAVSTHSRPKAAGGCGGKRRPIRRRFNTQPPEGGWVPAKD